MTHLVYIAGHNGQPGQHALPIGCGETREEAHALATRTIAQAKVSDQDSTLITIEKNLSPKEAATLKRAIEGAIK